MRRSGRKRMVRRMRPGVGFLEDMAVVVFLQDRDFWREMQG